MESTSSWMIACPLQQHVRSGLTDRVEAKSLVKRLRATELLDMKADRLSRRRAFREHLGDEHAADPLAPCFGQQRNIDDPDLFFRSIDTEPTDRALIADYQPVVGVRECLPVVLFLGVELHAQERVDLLLVPTRYRQFVHSRAGVHETQEGLIAGSDGSQPDGFAHRHQPLSATATSGPDQVRDGKTPWSAMQKLSTRYGGMLV